MSSRTRVRLPSLRCAASRASSGVIPRAMLSSVSIARYASSSRARSSSHWPRNQKRLMLIVPAGLKRPFYSSSAALSGPRSSRGTKDAVDRADDRVPAVRLFGELLAPGRSQPVIARLPVVLGGAPERRNPLAIFEPMERRVQRSVLDRQHVVGLPFNGVGDRVPVCRADGQCFQDQQVERPLEKIACFLSISTFCHASAIILH